MRRISATLRIAISITCLTVSLLLTAKLFGLIPDEREAILRSRGRVFDTLAIHSSHMLISDDIESLRSTLQRIVARDPDMRSVGLRHAESGELLIDVGGHDKKRGTQSADTSTDTQMLVPLRKGNSRWGNLEVTWCPVSESEAAPLFAWPTVAIVAYCGILGLGAYYVYLQLAVQQLNPGRIVPGHVREALNTQAEGLLIVDDKGRIVMANDAFSRVSGRSRHDLLGQGADDIPWIAQSDKNRTSNNDTDQPLSRPWTRAIESGTATSGDMLQLECDYDAITFLVNTTPIFDAEGMSRGALASFEDVTQLAEKKSELTQLVTELRESGDEIRRKNEELTQLATRDPLTDCLNRRSFFEEFEKQFETSERYGYSIAAVMVDIDQFKLINDSHGHAVGDTVLQKVAAALMTTARDSDTVCRYGGEEFSIVLPHTNIEAAEAAAEKFRIAIESLKIPKLSITASLGVSCTGLGSTDPQVLLDQADKCLYFAKRNGRNRVARFDRLPADIKTGNWPNLRTRPVVDLHENSIPFHAVTALISALGFRDQATAEHSRRVADLCVGVAEGMMSRRDCYVLEMAALLHDIGKVGVPDSILKKAGTLSPADWEVMRRHDRIGSEIIRSSFQSRQLSAIIDNYRTYYDGSDSDARESGTRIPLGARILVIADSYDAMVSDQIYRKAISQEEAFVELRKCMGTQFDPTLVDRFISNIMFANVVEEPVLSMSKETALSIGLQLERLATALDDHDLESLQIMASRIHGTAAREGVLKIATTAAQLETQVKSDGDLIEILHRANELMRQCRAARSSVLEPVSLADPVTAAVD
jgi:diguanylate cyclase (GGDEF)-like protein/PAS domain S-box-containing protein